MSDEEGRETDGEGEVAAPDWRVRAGPRSKPTQREREEHEATHVPFRDWCAYCMMGRGRTHHHVTKQKSEDQSRRPIIAMDYFFMRMESSPSVRTNNVHCGERRQISKHHEQRSAEERSRRAMDSRESGKIHRLAWLSRDHIEERYRTSNHRVQESSGRSVQSRSHDGRCSERRQRIERPHRERSDADSWNHPNHQVPQ